MTDDTNNETIRLAQEKFQKLAEELQIGLALADLFDDDEDEDEAE